MRVRVLGSAAGGGFPQWNCNCRNCSKVRDPTAAEQPRTQSSIAIQSADGRWYLINASPDLRQQLADLPDSNLPALQTRPLRASPVAAILLTDAEIDHTAGLLLLRESSEPLEIYSSAAVREALTTGYPVLEMLAGYCGVRWHELSPEGSVLLGDTLEVEMFATGGDPPLYMGVGAAGLEATGLMIRDRETGGVLAYVPALEAIDDELAGRLAASDCAIVDGTFWERDELVSLGLAQRDALAMGHVPLSGDGGSLGVLEALPARTILTHINNTNPILLESSSERAAVAAAGIEIAYDGMEIEL
jgi:pyrroloquinoline quinone biosynthesis protein B